MKKSQQRTADENTQREKNARSSQSASKPAPGQPPLKEHGQPAWREVKPN
jgi:hypothetical protein